MRSPRRYAGRTVPRSASGSSRSTATSGVRTTRSTTRSPCRRARPTTPRASAPSTSRSRAGLVEEAFKILEGPRAHDRGPAALARVDRPRSPWRICAGERAIEEIEKLHAAYPDQNYGKRLESLYRRLHKREKLAALLEQRLAGRHDPALEQEVLSLQLSLGRREEVRRILKQRFERAEDPDVFFPQLRSWRALEFERITGRARAIIESDRLEPRHVAGVAGALRPFFAEKEYAELGLAPRRPAPRRPGLARTLRRAHRSRPRRRRNRARLAKDVAKKHEGGHVPHETRGWSAPPGRDCSRTRSSRARRCSSRTRTTLRTARASATCTRRRRATRTRPSSGVSSPSARALTSPAVLRLVNALFHLKEVEEAMVWLERRAALPETTLEDRLEVAEQLFGTKELDRGARLLRGGPRRGSHPPARVAARRTDPLVVERSPTARFPTC